MTSYCIIAYIIFAATLVYCCCRLAGWADERAGYK